MKSNMVLMGYMISISFVVLLFSTTVFGGSKTKYAKKVRDNLKYFKNLEKVSPVIYMHGTTFRKRILQLPRNFSIFLALTVLNRPENCKFCGLLHEEFKSVAENYKLSKQEGLFFVYLDYDRDNYIFHELKIEYLPQYWFFDNKGDLKKHRKFPPMISFKASDLVKGLRHISGIKIDIRAKQNNELKWAALGVIIVGIFMTRLTLVRLVISDRYFWAVGTLVFIICFSSGIMINLMNYRPFMFDYKDLSLRNVFNPHSNNLIESGIVAGSYALCTCFIAAIYVSGKLANSRPYVKLGLEALFTLGLLVTVSFMVKLYRMKNPMYAKQLIFS